ncbi:hypothetical protein [Butyrivibrio sp. FCS014]|uniref:hypothetical protein n=1 Tax=Butyrivibrio sp. FCS014 TaxID=1408304 RepID=UPI000467BF30|nr:hypothetical protein [Butyrivibrio sp. FCS014]
MGRKALSITNNPDPGRRKGTFVVKIEYCQNETWQGKVVWAEENRTERFRSMLELVKLMDEAMASGQQISIEQQA